VGNYRGKRERERETERDRDRDRERKRERKRERERERRAQGEKGIRRYLAKCYATCWLEDFNAGLPDTNIYTVYVLTNCTPGIGCEWVGGEM
jgi:hypothetical protein